mgnify:CR=1 FL=1
MAALVLFASSVVDLRAEPNVLGQTGYVYMPDARIAEEGTLRFGVSKDDPYFTLWSSVTFLPRLELSARFTKIDGVPGSATEPEFGDFRDKSFDAKAVLLKESRYFPQLSIGAQDFTGTQISKANFIALSKRIGPIDFTAGYGTDRIDGAFGGLRYSPSWLKDFSFVLEHDATHYKKDFRADLSGADKRKGGATVGARHPRHLRFSTGGGALRSDWPTLARMAFDPTDASPRTET